MANPTPSPGPTPTSASVGGFTFTVPQTGGTSTDLFGLGAWRDQTIDASQLPASVVIALRTSGIDTSQPVKASDLAKALEGIHDPQAVAQLQQLMFYSGMYSSGVKLSDLDLGRFGDQDTKALATAIQTAGQTSSSLGSYLTTAARTGVALGVVNTPQVTPLKAPSTIDEDAALRAAAHELTGREPNAQDLAGFRAFYDQAYMAGQKQAQQLAAQTIGVDPEQLGAAMQRLGVPNPATGIPIGDAAEAPPATLTGLPSSQMRNPDFAGTDAFHPANPAFGQFQQQRQADLSTLAQAQQGLAGGQPVLRDAPDITAAAEEYLRQNDAADVAQQNVATKYRTLLSILGGAG